MLFTGWTVPKPIKGTIPVGSIQILSKEEAKK